MREFVINIYLLAGAYEDKKTKRIKTLYLWLGGLLGIVCKMVDFGNKNLNFYEWIFSVIPGLLFLICAKAGNEKIGDGDGWVLIILGSCLPGVQIWGVFYFSVLLSAFYSLILLVMKKANRKTEIPYIPFLWMSDVVIRGLQYVL